VRDEVMVRCVNMPCARLLARRVNFCPYCGTGQATGLVRPPNADAAVAAAVVAAPAPAPARPPMAEPPVNIAKAPTPAPPAPGIIPVPAVPAAPPRPRPIRLRWWLVALAALWLIWVSQRPSTARLDARVDKAVALAVACKANEAQAELIALKKTTATPGQLARLQTALNDADVACRRPVRAKPPTKAPAPARAASQSVRNLVSDARSDLVRGDYRAAADKMEVCVAMVDANTAECSAVKALAEKADTAMRRCVTRGGEWVGESCQ
jgi:hypothetical protein